MSCPRRDRVAQTATCSGRPTRLVAIMGVWATLVAVACDPATRQGRPPTAAGTISVYQADLFYQKLGTGEPIVVVHGGPGLDHSYLRPWFEPLAETHQVILYDQRGVGGSDAVLDSASISMTRYLTDLDRIREQVAGRERVTLLAHSWGAIPALLYAIEAPERVEALILVNPVEPGSRFREQADANVLARRDSVDAAALDSIRRTPAFASREVSALNQFYFHVFRGTFADPRVADTLLALDLQPRTARQGQRVATLLMTPLQGLDFWDDLDGLQIPTLIIHGDRDPNPLEMVQALNEALPQSRLVVLESTGHFPFIEAAPAFFAAIRDFLGESVQAAP